MYTGIVQATAPIVTLTRNPGLLTFTVRLPRACMRGIKKGASISVDGVCLTVVTIRDTQVTFDAMEETLKKTTLGTLEKNTRVNIERSLHAGDEIGGHLLSGHVTGMAKIIRVEISPNNHVCTFQVPREWMPYILPKGFIALDGASLTIVDINKKMNTFSVHFIPETLRKTTFGWKREGSLVNLEVDSRTQAIVDTVRTYMQLSNGTRRTQLRP